MGEVGVEWGRLGLSGVFGMTHNKHHYVGGLEQVYRRERIENCVNSITPIVSPSSGGTYE